MIFFIIYLFDAARYIFFGRELYVKRIVFLFLLNVTNWLASPLKFSGRVINNSAFSILVIAGIMLEYIDIKS